MGGLVFLWIPLRYLSSELTKLKIHFVQQFQVKIEHSSDSVFRFRPEIRSDLASDGHFESEFSELFN